MWWAFVFYFFLLEMADYDLIQSEEKYRTILGSIEDGYFEVDLAGNFTFFNDPICEILGYPRDELMGMNNRRYTDKDNAKKLYLTFNKVYATGRSTKEFDWQIIRKDGTSRHVDASVSLIKDSKDHPIGFRGIEVVFSATQKQPDSNRSNDTDTDTDPDPDTVGRWAPNVVFSITNTDRGMGYSGKHGTRHCTRWNSSLTTAPSRGTMGPGRNIGYACRPVA